MGEICAAYPPPPASTAYVAPPPAGYPTKDGQYPQNPVPVETKSRGDGFWKGWYVTLCRPDFANNTEFYISNLKFLNSLFMLCSCAALCCCCMLDACF